MAEGSIIVAYCGVCDNARYRSKRPLGKGDKPTPADFEVAHPEQAPPESFDARTPLSCSTCGGAIKFIPEQALGNREGPAERTPRRVAPSAPPAGDSIETLFAVQGDEAIKEMKETPAGLVIITNKRIVRVQV